MNFKLIETLSTNDINNLFDDIIENNSFVISGWGYNDACSCNGKRIGYYFFSYGYDCRFYIIDEKSFDGVYTDCSITGAKGCPLLCSYIGKYFS